jgi:hypothetical protein
MTWRYAGTHCPHAATIFARCQLLQFPDYLFFFVTMRHFLFNRMPEPRRAHTHSLHYADAYEVESAANKETLSRIEMMFEIGPLKNLEQKVSVFIDVIMEGRKLQRLEERGQIPDVADLNFPLRQLLKHVPIQEWPFPHSPHCPCSFCDAHGDRDALELHLVEDHPLVFQMEGYHSETQLVLARLLGIALKVKKRKRWKCPFGYCSSDIDTYSEVADHVLNTDFHRH